MEVLPMLRESEEEFEEESEEEFEDDESSCLESVDSTLWGSDEEFDDSTDIGSADEGASINRPQSTTPNSKSSSPFVVHRRKRAATASPKGTPTKRQTQSNENGSPVPEPSTALMPPPTNPPPPPSPPASRPQPTTPNSKSVSPSVVTPRKRAATASPRKTPTKRQTQSNEDASTALMPPPTSPRQSSSPASRPRPSTPKSKSSSPSVVTPRKRAATASPRRTPTKRQTQSPAEDQDENQWRGVDEEDELPHQFPFCPQRTPGVQLDRQKDYRPSDLFMLFFSEDVLKVLCKHTNANAKRRPLRGLWKPVEPEDIMKYVSIVIYLGLVKPSAMRDLWRKDRLHNHPFPTSVMAGYRFELIGAFLHMSDPAADIVNDKLRGQAGYDPLFRLKPLQDQILAACKEHYHPHQNISIDERMVASKARHGMKQYMKDKPIKWGFKLFVLADSKTGYTVNFNVYQGKAHTPSGNELSYDAVVNLLDVPFLGTGYNVYVDNFYTSTALFLHLHQTRYGACGTMRDNRIGFPKNRRNALPSTAERGAMRWIREGPLLYVKWKDTKEVTVCSSLHKAYSGETVQRRVRNPDGSGWTKRAVPVPEPVREYNKYMGGVDLSDALIKYFSVTQKTMRWYKKLFLHFVDIAVVNSFIMYKELALEKQKAPLTQKSFREALCLELADYRGVTVKTEEVEAEPQAPILKPREAEPKPKGCFPVPVADVSAADARNKTTTGRQYCVQCRAQGKRNKTIFKCRSCDVPLCMIADRLCFTEWHDSKSSQKKFQTAVAKTD